MSRPITQDDLFSIMQQYEDQIRAINLALRDTVPTGGIIIWPGATIPEGWLWAGGQEVARDLYPALFNVVGTRFGTPSSGAMFKLPQPPAPGTNMIYIIKT